MKSRNKKLQAIAPEKVEFDAQAFLDSTGVARKVKGSKRLRSSTLKAMLLPA